MGYCPPTTLLGRKYGPSVGLLRKTHDGYLDEVQLASKRVTRDSRQRRRQRASKCEDDAIWDDEEWQEATLHGEEHENENDDVGDDATGSCSDTADCDEVEEENDDTADMVDELSKHGFDYFGHIATTNKATAKLPQEILDILVGHTIPTALETYRRLPSTGYTLHAINQEDF
ncbi:hypothetical protein CLAFUW4_10747 [Fulvia fulva]|uniref:Uncharacterized protein n=1 Tax=Passalora fulva TaxID=5499 RepID=A0A9Q8P8C7_PASFU|nr:uncharacterized protein CLAFUR5_05360 [Fulvia fulva]KAK4615431.1 hypothetical protein CLAFUR4_10752 [Fulvia fulva]KAK4616517.1 hypothetical protein CLAFUR0_10759 [Fulvia fulva]UJO16877.1 hypothetical protein CLAFUR5_05360 [Fulvia fulva]WPV19742.1 hypothetical protein CLAFUW4_10747 [Fulvia fulva]WPV33708.1 hypothetical protein CLAFUW7_10749 [Fulvia fulva]